MRCAHCASSSWIQISRHKERELSFRSGFLISISCWQPVRESFRELTEALACIRCSYTLMPSDESYAELLRVEDPGPPRLKERAGDRAKLHSALQAIGCAALPHSLAHYRVVEGPDSELAITRDPALWMDESSFFVPLGFRAHLSWISQRAISPFLREGIDYLRLRDSSVRPEIERLCEIQRNWILGLSGPEAAASGELSPEVARSVRIALPTGTVAHLTRLMPEKWILQAHGILSAIGDREDVPPVEEIAALIDLPEQEIARALRRARVHARRQVAASLNFPASAFRAFRRARGLSAFLRKHGISKFEYLLDMSNAAWERLYAAASAPLRDAVVELKLAVIRHRESQHRSRKRRA